MRDRTPKRDKVRKRGAIILVYREGVERVVGRRKNGVGKWIAVLKIQGLKLCLHRLCKKNRKSKTRYAF